MKKPWGRAVRLALMIGLLGVLSCRRPDPLPVVQLEPGPFVHKVTAEGTLRATETTKIAVPPTVRSRVRLAWVAPEGMVLEEGDLVARFDGKEFEVKLEDAQSDLSGTRQDIETTRAESDTKLGGYRRDYETAELELTFAERFRLTDELVFSRVEIAEDVIDEELAGARRDHAEDMSGIQQQLAETELAILDIQKRKSTIKIDEAETGLSSLEVRAPHRGIFTLSRNWRGERVAVGSEMWRGQGIGEIPALDTIEAEVFVLEADAGGVAEGQRARVVVESSPEKVHLARVASVEAAAKPRFRGSPVQYFSVTLSFDHVNAREMKPGQRIAATLVLEELEDVLVVPRQAVHQEDGRFWVYRRAGRSFSPTTVEVGSRSAALLVVEQGLAAGDVVALARPPDAADPKPAPEVAGGA